MIDNEPIKSCSICKYYHFYAPQFDQPYPEFNCGKGHWNGIASTEEYEALFEEIDCVDFNLNK